MSMNTPIAFSYIRFSTPEQSLGDSERRQVAAAELWAKAKGMSLDRSYSDRGKSGYKGTNRKKGALGEFLKRQAAGEIPPGSFLIVEDMDRLSREHPLDSIILVRRIVQAGVTIVTLKNNNEYSEKSIRDNQMQMMELVFELGRASGESSRKSDLITKSWEKRRGDAAKGKPISSIAPGWLVVEGTGDDRRYAINPQRAEIVRDIFTWTLQGIGHRTVAKKLNDAKVETFGTGKGKARAWDRGYIHKIINDRAVIGEYQPHKMITEPDPELPGETMQVRRPFGDPVKDYYPAVIDLETFQRVQASRPKTGGATSNRVSMLFPQLLIDSATGSQIYYHAHAGKHGGHGRYVVSDVAAFNRERTEGTEEATVGRWPYPSLEYAILSTLQEIDWRALSEEGRPEEEKELANKAAALEMKVMELKRQGDNLAGIIAITPLTPLIEKLSALETERKTAEEQAKKLRMQLEALGMAASAVKEAFLLPEDAYNPEARDTRLALRAEIARRVEKIILGRKDAGGMFQISIAFRNGAFRFIRVRPVARQLPKVMAVAFETAPNAIKVEDIPLVEHED